MGLKNYYDKGVILSLVKLGAPVIAGNVGLVLMGLIDNAMVGKLGYVPLAAAGISNTVFFIATIFGIGVLMVISASISGEQTKKDPQTPQIIRAAIVINVLVSIFTFVVLWALEHNFHWFGQTTNVQEAAVPYFRIIRYSVWPMFIYLTFKSVADGHNLTRAAMYATLAALLLNTFLNWLLIYGNWGFEAYGLVGAGYATMVSRTFMALFTLFYCMYQPKIKFFWNQIFKPFYKEHVRLLLDLGIPSGGQLFFEVSAFAGAAIISGWIGEVELAAHTVAIQLAALTYMFASGLSVAGMIQTGATWAQNKREETLAIGRNVTLMTSIFMGCAALIFVFFRTQLVSIFAQNDAVIDLASKLMMLAALFQFFDGLQAVSIGLLRGMNDTKIPSYITLISYWIVSLPLAYYFGLYTEMKTIGVWIALTLALILASLFLYRRFITLVQTDEIENSLTDI